MAYHYELDVFLAILFLCSMIFLGLLNQSFILLSFTGLQVVCITYLGHDFLLQLMALECHQSGSNFIL